MAIGAAVKWFVSILKKLDLQLVELILVPSVISLFVPSRNNAFPYLVSCTDNKIERDVLVAENNFGIGKNPDFKQLKCWRTSQ